MSSRFIATYHVRTSAADIESRAQGIAIEQSVEMPLEAIDDPAIHSDIVGDVVSITGIGDDLWEVRVALATATVGGEAGQLFNMLLGNSSMHSCVTLVDAELPAAIVDAFRGPNLGIPGIRARLGVPVRALTCGALKPQGSSPARLADLAARMAAGGVDMIKDDHGIANQAYSPFAARVPAIAAAVRRTGAHTSYIPSLNGNLDTLRAQIRLSRNEGLDMFMVGPMILGLPTVELLARENPECAFFAHPTLTGVGIAPPMLFGKLFRLLGCDALIYANYGGRFGYSKETCLTLAENGRAPWFGIKTSFPVPAGGMVQARVPEMLDFFGPDTILLIGGGLLLAREKLTQEVAAFTEAVANYRWS